MTSKLKTDVIVLAKQSKTVLNLLLDLLLNVTSNLSQLKREVLVYKLISKESIDESMLKIQQNKLELGNDLNGQNDGI